MDDPDPDQSNPRLRHSSFPFRTLLIALAALAVVALLFPGVVLAQVGPSRAGPGLNSILLLIALIVLSGLMSGAQTALATLGSWKIRQLRNDGKDPGGMFAVLEREPTRFVTTLLIAGTVANTAAVALVTDMALTIARTRGTGEAAAVGYAIVVSTLLIVLFVEITPKSIAVHHPLTVARGLIRPVYALSIVFYPLGLAFTWLTASVLRLLRMEPVGNPLLTENELRLMLRSAEESGVLEAQEEEMIKGIIDLEETVVREVMTPRVDVVAISKDATMLTLLELATEHGYSRLPVYDESIDAICGTVYARDLLNYLGRPESLEQTRVEDIMTMPQYVPETLSILNLLRDMRIRKNHMAVVVDEFGGTAGVITLEDIIEEITGEIYDETDEVEDEDIVRLEDGQYRIQGSAHLEQVGHDLHLDFDDDGEYDTVAGFLIDEMGYIPGPGESLVYQGIRFVVERADERRIVTVLAQPEIPAKDVEALDKAEESV